MGHFKTPFVHFTGVEGEVGWRVRLEGEVGWRVRLEGFLRDGRSGRDECYQLISCRRGEGGE